MKVIPSSMLLNYSVLVGGDQGTPICVCSYHCSKVTKMICEYSAIFADFVPRLISKNHIFQNLQKHSAWHCHFVSTCVNHMHIDMLGVAGAGVTLVLAAVILKADNIKIQIIIMICSVLTGVAWLMMRLEVVWSPLSLMTTVPPRSRS